VEITERLTGEIMCPECGVTRPALEVYHHDRDGSWSAAPPSRP